MINSDQRIKILFVLPSLAPGGIERHFVRQTRYFDASKYSLHVATLFYYPEKDSFYKELPPHVSFSIFHFVGRFDIKSLIQFVRFLRSMNPDIVVSSMFSANTLVRVLSLFLGFSTIVREHNIYDEKKWWQRLTDRFLSFVSYRIVPVSDDVGNFIIKQEGISPKRITVIANGIDIEEIESGLEKADKRVVRQELGMTDSDKLIVNIARLKEQKNHDLLIRSFAIFHTHYPHYHLAILGDGNERRKLEKLVDELGVTRYVHILGFRRDVYNFYATADFFVLSSRREGFPNVVLESLACGLPVISTPVAGVGEIIEQGKNGYLVRDQGELLDAMEVIASLSTAGKHQMSNISKASAKKFDMTVNVGHYEALFQECFLEEGKHMNK